MTYRSGRVAAALDDLVADARSSRDGAFNTLDAVQRQTTSAADALAKRIEKFRADRFGRASVRVEAERDARFDPEDEWEVVGPSAVASGAAASTAPRGSAGPNDDAGDDAGDPDDYPQTWLR